MFEKIKYINNKNEVVEFGDDVVFANYNDLRDYSWQYDTDFNRLSNFRRDITTKSLPIIINAKTEEDGARLKNKIFEVFEKDVLMNKKGKFIIGDYYYKCFITEAVNSEYLYCNGLLYKSLSIVTDEPYWVKEKEHNFFITAKESASSFYPYDYPYDYSNNLGSRTIINDNFIDTNIKIIIYGPVVNPVVFIGAHPYAVETAVFDGEYLTIDTKNKTAIKTKNNGDTINEFHKRNKQYSVFQKMKAGSSTVSWNENFNFTIITIEERSEPKWI